MNSKVLLLIAGGIGVAMLLGKKQATATQVNPNTGTAGLLSQINNILKTVTGGTRPVTSTQQQPKPQQSKPSSSGGGLSGGGLGGSSNTARQPYGQTAVDQAIMALGASQTTDVANLPLHIDWSNATPNQVSYLDQLYDANGDLNIRVPDNSNIPDAAAIQEQQQMGVVAPDSLASVTPINADTQAISDILNISPISPELAAGAVSDYNDPYGGGGGGSDYFDPGQWY